MAVAFTLTLGIREAPLRKTVRGEGQPATVAEPA
jgi:hypothetical protein